MLGFNEMSRSSVNYVKSWHHCDFVLPRINDILLSFVISERMLDLSTLGREAHFLVLSLQLFSCIALYSLVYSYLIWQI